MSWCAAHHAGCDSKCIQLSWIKVDSEMNEVSKEGGLNKGCQNKEFKDGGLMKGCETSKRVTENPLARTEKGLKFIKRTLKLT